MPRRSSNMILKTTRKYMKYFYIVLGVFMAAIGICCTAFSKIFADRFIDHKMQLRPGGDITQLWSHPDVNITLDFKFFNWTNSEQFYNIQTKPQFDQVGPYAYTEVPIKKIFKWHPENNTMEYGKTHYYYLNETRTNGSLDDTLISLNALLVGAASKSRHWSYVKRTVIDMALRYYKNGPVWKKSADEFFFKGFKDDIVDLLAILPTALRSSLGLLLPWDRIGYSYARNGSTDFLGVHSIHTGIGDMDKYGQMVQWKGKNYSEAFDKECNAVRGSAGEFQKTNLKKNESIVYFFSDFCRTAEMDYVDEVMVEGVKGYRYRISPKTFDNGFMYPDTKCFCNGDCLPYGAFNISSCYFGLPVFVSKPHFLDADPFYMDQVEGMKPNRTIHDTTMILEPRTGLMLELKGRLQLNIYIRPTTHIVTFPNKRDMLFPVVWFDMHARVSKTGALLLRIVNNLTLFGHVFGLLILLVGTVIVLWHPCKKRWNKRYVQHMEINTMADDDYDNDDIEEAKAISNKENLFGLRSNFPSLMYITHPRRSLPIIISHIDGDEEAWRSCLDDEQRQQFELEAEECDTSFEMNS